MSTDRNKRNNIHVLKPALKKVALALLLGSTQACSSFMAHDIGGEDGRVMLYGDAHGVASLFDGINGNALVSKMNADDTTRDNPYHEMRRHQDATRRMKYFIQRPAHKPLNRGGKK